MDGTQVSVLEQTNKIGFRCFLETQYGHRLESQVCLEILGDLPHQSLEGQLTNEESRALLEVTNVTQHRCSSSVSMWFDLSALHPRLVYLLQLSLGPLHHTETQLGPLFGMWHIEGSQVSINWWINHTLSNSWANVLTTICWLALPWLLPCHRVFWWLGRLAGLPPLTGIIVQVVVISATLSAPAWVITPGLTYATTTTCAGTAATTCAGTAAASWSSSSPTATTTSRWLLPQFTSTGATHTISGFSAHSGPIR